MNHYKLQDLEIKAPTCYNDITFKQYIKIFDGKEKRELDLLSILLDVDKEILGQIKMGESFSQLIKDVSFIKTPIDIDYIPPQRIKLNEKTVELPLDIGNETTAQYSDLRDLLDKETNQNLLMACAIYLQPLVDGQYNINKAKLLTKDIENLPCDFVLCMGSFFLSRALGLQNGFLKTFLRAGTRMRRFKQAMNNIRKRLAL